MTTFREKISQIRAAGVEIGLAELVAFALTHEVTEEEREEQRQSWVVSELMLSNPKLRKNRAESLYKEARNRVNLNGRV